MANMSLPPEERNLTPDQVEALDMRRRRGSMLLTLAGMFTIIAVLLTCWVGQDLQYAPGLLPPHDLLLPGRVRHRSCDTRQRTLSAPRCSGNSLVPFTSTSDLELASQALDCPILMG